jgi:hypothetical protein
MGAAKTRGAAELNALPGRHTSQQPPGNSCGLGSQKAGDLWD